MSTNCKRITRGAEASRFLLSDLRPIHALFYLSVILLFQLAFVPVSQAWDPPFNNAANWGGTGLLEIPTARILEDGEVRAGYAQALPYRWVVVGMGPFPGLEGSFRYTILDEVPTRLGPEFGSYKDKSLDLKYQILPESKKLPAIAIGLHDIQGTKLFESQYLVFSRQVFPLDFTLGFGLGRLDGIFGGIEWAVNKWVHLLAEYNPIEYEEDKGAPGRALPEGAKWPVNVGMRLKVLKGLDLGLSYQRGDTLGFMGHLQFGLGKPLRPWKPDPPQQVPVDRRPFQERDSKEMIMKIHKAIREAGLVDVSVYTNGKDLVAEFENGRYLSEQKAVGRVLRILLFYSPSDTKKLTVVTKKRDIPILKVSVKPDHLEKYLFGKISDDMFARLIEIETTKQTVDYGQGDFIQTEEERKIRLNFGIKPDISTWLNDPSGVFKYRLAIKPFIAPPLWKGAMFYARYDIPLYSNISSSNIVLPDAVRSDAWLYLDDSSSFERLLINQTVRLTEKTFGRLSVGYLERMYAGLSGEILSFLGGGSLALGIEADWGRKREPGTPFDLTDLRVYSVLGNLYYRLPIKGLDMRLKAQYGRFLAGDVGLMLDLNRQFDTGVIVGAFYSFTDTDDLSGFFNQGYHQKGVYLSLPASMFWARDSRTRYNFALSPWTRDVGATFSHWQRLFLLANELMPTYFRSKLPEIKE